MVRCIPEHGPLACGGVDGIGFEAALQMLAYEHDAQVQKLKLEVSKLMRACHTKAGAEADALAQAAGIGPRALPRPPPAVLAAPLMPGAGNVDGKVQIATRLSGNADALEDDETEEDQWSPGKTLTLIRSVVSESRKGVRLSSCSHDAGFFTMIRTRTKDNVVLGDAIMGVVIMLNILLLGVSADVAPNSVVWVVIDALFALVFLSEILIKLRVVGVSIFFFGHEKVMNWFEAGLALLALLESVVACVQMSLGASGGAHLLSLFRALRICRVIRIVRVIRLEMFNELKNMIRGTVGGMKVLAWSTLLIVAPVYTMCLLLREALGDEKGDGSGAEYFSSMPRAFFSVFRCIVIEECAANDGRPLYVLITENFGWQYGILYCVVAVFMSFGLYNVIVAMFVENVVESSKERDRVARKERLRDRAFFGRKMAELLHIVYNEHEGSSQNGGSSTTLGSQSTGSGGEQFSRRSSNASIFALVADMELTPEMFESIRELPRVQKILDELDVADDDQHNLFETLDADGGGTIDMEEFCSGIAKLRGDPCRSDIISINFKIQNVQSELQACMSTFVKRLQLQHELVESICSKLDVGGF